MVGANHPQGMYGVHFEKLRLEFLHVNSLIFIICPISFSKFSNIELWHKNGIYIYTCVIKCLYVFIFLYYIHIVYKNCYI